MWVVVFSSGLATERVTRGLICVGRLQFDLEKFVVMNFTVTLNSDVGTNVKDLDITTCKIRPARRMT